MKKLLIALAAAATAVVASAEITNQLDFEGADGTAYANDAPSVAANYPFASFGSKYRELEESYKPDVNSGNILDMYAEFVACDEACGLEEGEKLGVYVDKTDGCLVVVGRDVTKISNVDTEGWHRLTVVPSGTADFYVYVDGQKVQNEPFAGAGEDNSISEMEFKGSGKLDNFVARTTNPFGGAPAGWVAKVGDDPEQYFTDYTKALEKALAGATLTFADENVQMDGTAAHPFEIRSAADLKALADAVNAGKSADKCFVQTDNIDMKDAGAFAGIGVYAKVPTAGKPFTGTYNGQNHKIMNVTRAAGDTQGVFNQVGVGGVVENLVVSNMTFDSSLTGDYGCAIVGNAGGGATLRNLTAEGVFGSADKPGTHNMAGIVVRVCGGADSATVTTVANCKNNAAIYGAYTKLGGICAIAQTQTGFTAGSVLFQNCANTGALTSSYDGTKATGFAGILAYSTANTVLDGCTNTGTLSNTSETANTDVNGSLVGTVQNYTLTLKSAIASGDIGKFNAGCTVALDFDVSGNNVDFNLYGAIGTTVELLQNFTGYPPRNAVIDPTLKLSANMTINDGWQNETNATFTAISGTGTLTASHPYDYVKVYRIKKLDGFTGTLASQSRVYFDIDDIVAAETPAYGTAVVKGGSSLKVYDLASTTLGGVAADLCVDTLDNQNGIYLAAAQVVADDELTTGYASVANALAAADAAYASTVNVLDQDAVEVEKTGWSYDNGVYTSTRAIATLKGTTYPSLTKALAAAAEDDEVVLVGATSESVTIPAGVTVAVTDGVEFNGTVAGAGAVKFTAAQTGTIKFGEWTGTVTLDWADIVNNGDIAPVMTRYGKEGSTVEIGPNGTITGTSYFNTAPVATLKVSGFVSIDNGSSYTQRAIPTVTGDGVLVFGASGTRVNYRITNLVDWNGVITNSSSKAGIANITSGSGKVVYASTPDIAPKVGEGYTGGVYLNFNYSNYNVASYGGVNATRFLGTMTGHLHDGAGESGQTGIVAGKTVVSGDVVINNGWTQYPGFDWTGSKTVQFDAFTVDGSFSLVSAQTWNSAYCYYYIKSLNGDGAGAITVGKNFALRIDAVDFATAPSGKNALVNLTLTGDKPGLLYGPNGVAGEQIPVTVNGVATEQTLVYDADKGGLVLYVAPIAFIYDENGNLLQEIPAGDKAVMQAAMAFLQMEIGESIKFASSIENTEFHAMFLAGCTYDATTFTYTRKHEAAVAKITVGQKDYTFPTLAAAIEAAHDGETVVLLDNIALTEMQAISKSVTLDLNGKNVTATDCRAFHVTAGTVAFTGTGTISTVVTQGTKLASSSSVIRVGSNTAETNFTLGENVTVTSDYCYGITYFGTMKQTVVINGTVTVTGVQAAISGNGLASYNTAAGGSDVTVNGTVSATQDYAIYNPQTGTTAITGTVTGGIEVKAGTVTVAGTATVTARNVTPSHSSNQNGTSTQGYAIASVGNSSYKQPAKVSVAAGATVTGSVIILKENNSATYGEITSAANTLTIPAGYVWNGPADGVYTLAVASGFDGGASGKSFTIDGEVTLPAGKVLTDTASAATGLTYAQAAVLGLLDETTGELEKDVTPTISIVNGKVVVSLDGTAVNATRYTVMLNVYEKASLTDKWLTEPTKRYKLGSEEEFTLSEGGSGFYKVGVTIEDAAVSSGN